MTESELQAVSSAIWDALSHLVSGGRGYSRDAWREAVGDPHERIMSAIKSKVSVEPDEEMT